MPSEAAHLQSEHGRRHAAAGAPSRRSPGPPDCTVRGSGRPEAATQRLLHEPGETPRIPQQCVRFRCLRRLSCLCRICYRLLSWSVCFKKPPAVMSGLSRGSESQSSSFSKDWIFASRPWRLFCNRHRLNEYLASWVPSPPGERTSQNCTIQAVPKTAGKKKTRYP